MAGSRFRTGSVVGPLLAGASVDIAMIPALSAAAELPAATRPLVMGTIIGAGLTLNAFVSAEIITSYSIRMDGPERHDTVLLPTGLRTASTTPTPAVANHRAS